MASNVLKLRIPQTSMEPLQPVGTMDIRHKGDVLEAAIEFDRIAKERGLRIMMWHDISSREPMVDAEGRSLNDHVFGCEAQNGDLYGDYEKALRSQLFRACRVETEPFWVNSQGFHLDWRNEYLDEIKLHDFETKCLIKAAIVVPVHLAFGQIAAVTFISLDEKKEVLAEEFAQFGKLLTGLARRFVVGYNRILKRNPYLPTETLLTNREIECIRWAAFGKTDREVGMILDCSHATVRYHIKRACQKLGAVNRTQTVFKACQLGFVRAAS